MAADRVTIDPSDREFLFFVKLFKFVNLQADVGLKLYKAQRTDYDRQFYTVFNELNLLLDPIQDYQETLAKSWYKTNEAQTTFLSNYCG